MVDKILCFFKRTLGKSISKILFNINLKLEVKAFLRKLFFFRCIIHCSHELCYHKIELTNINYILMYLPNSILMLLNIDKFLNQSDFNLILMLSNFNLNIPLPILT